ncbi:hypothetical protein PFLUV_G00260460 [Perca fluviatilis]|uniref:Uncharacterized protein n=1 Tax=Perca fluviatilis TaxID=8168 RepID=A0A6A5E7Q1_PERFL|nr:hypothetical protein PFLUV_G00260460 [Perca fluviatilis]
MNFVYNNSESLNRFYVNIVNFFHFQSFKDGSCDHEIVESSAVPVENGPIAWPVVMLCRILQNQIVTQNDPNHFICNSPVYPTTNLLIYLTMNVADSECNHKISQ